MKAFANRVSKLLLDHSESSMLAERMTRHRLLNSIKINERKQTRDKENKRYRGYTTDLSYFARKRKVTCGVYNTMLTSMAPVLPKKEI